MASSMRMMNIGIVWTTGMFALFTMGFLGGMIFNYILSFFAGFPIAAPLKQGAGLLWWCLPLYYALIIICAIILTYRCYQETVVQVDYMQDMGGNY